jgi:hypothetical protein
MKRASEIRIDANAFLPIHSSCAHSEDVVAPCVESLDDGTFLGETSQSERAICAQTKIDCRTTRREVVASNRTMWRHALWMLGPRRQTNQSAEQRPSRRGRWRRRRLAGPAVELRCAPRADEPRRRRGWRLKARVLGILLIGAPASADPASHAVQRHGRLLITGLSKHGASQARPAPTGATNGTRIATTSARDESPARPPSIDPATASRVIAARMSPDHAMLQRSVVERPSSWADPVKAESRRWRPKLMLYPMSSMASGTGGKGVKLKLRF